MLDIATIIEGADVRTHYRVGAHSVARPAGDDCELNDIASKLAATRVYHSRRLCQNRDMRAVAHDRAAGLFSRDGEHRGLADFDLRVDLHDHFAG